MRLRIPLPLTIMGLLALFRRPPAVSMLADSGNGDRNADEDGEAEWLIPLEGTNLSHKHREEAIKLMNRAEKEEQMLNLKLEKERLKQTQRLEDRERYDREGSLKEIVYSNKDLGKTIKHLRNQMDLG